MNRMTRALRAMFPPSDPSPADLARVEHSYRQRIRTRPWPRRKIAIFAAAAVVAFIAVVVSLPPAPLQASLSEIAQAARTVEPSDLDDGDYFFTESTSTFEQTIDLEDGRQLTYTIEERRRVWVSRSGTQVVIESTRTNPTFETVNDRELYFNLGLEPLDNLNETQISAVDGVSHDATERDWPGEPAALLRAIRDLPNVATGTQAAIQLLDLITESPAPPHLRAATIETIARLDLELVDRTPDAITVRTKPTALDNQIIEFTLDAHGQLRQRTDINHDPTAPARDVVVMVVEYSPTVVVEGPPQP